ncbi:MAG: DUF402 domain-containing protein [Streptomycetales bacterium]
MTAGDGLGPGAPQAGSYDGSWRPGDQILWRYCLNGEVRDARPVTVVADTPELTVAWLAPDTPIRRPVLADGSAIRSAPLSQRFLRGWSTTQTTWHGPGILKLLPWGAAHSVWVVWRPDGTLRGWYVNLEARQGRWWGGIDTTDHVLDLWVGADRRVEWKDEDEFAAAQQAGRFTAAEAQRIRSEGERVSDIAARWDSPFRDGWEDFQPDPAWPLPPLPDHWASPPATP